MKKSLFYSVAIATAMASCTQEAIEMPSNNVQDLSIRPTLGEIVLVQDAEIASRFAVGNGAQPVFSKDDKLGAAIMDMPLYPGTPYNEKNPAGNYSIVEYYSSNSAFTYDGNAWYLNEDQPLVEGNYMFYAPYNAAMQFRSAFEVAVPEKQAASTEKAALDEFYASGAVVRVGAQFLAAEGGVAQKPKVTMNDVFAYPKFTIKNNFSGIKRSLTGRATEWAGGDLSVDSIQLVLTAANNGVALKGKLSNQNASDIMNSQWAETPFENYTAQLLDAEATMAQAGDVITTLVAGGREIKKGESAVFYAVMPAARYAQDVLAAKIYVTIDGKPYVFNKGNWKKTVTTSAGVTLTSYTWDDQPKNITYKTTTGPVTLIKGQRYPQEELNFEEGVLSSKSKIAGNALTLDIKGGFGNGTTLVEYLQEVEVETGSTTPGTTETDKIDDNAEFIAFIKDLENGTNYIEDGRYPDPIAGDLFDFSDDNTVVINSELVEALSKYNHKGSMSIATTFPIANDVTVAYKAPDVVTFTSENGVSYDLTLITGYTISTDAVVATGKSVHVINAWSADAVAYENVIVYEGAEVTIAAIDVETASFINNGTVKVDGSNVINAVTNNGTIELVDPQYLVVDEGNGVIKATATAQTDVDNLNNVEVIGGTQTGLYIVGDFTADAVAEAEEITWVTDLKVNNGNVTITEEKLDEFVDIAKLHITGATFPIGEFDMNGLTFYMEGTSPMTIQGKSLSQTTVENLVIYNATAQQINLVKIDAYGTYNKIEKGGSLVTNANAKWNGAAYGVDAKTYLTEALVDEEVTEIVLPSSVTLDEPLTINRNVTIDLNGKTIESTDEDALIVTKGTLTITGDGEVIASGNNTQSACAVWVNGSDAVAVIKGGTFKVGGDNGERNDCIYVGLNGGKIYIEGGSFEYTGVVASGEVGTLKDGNRFLVNQKDNHTEQLIFITGGQFKNFNPSNANTQDGWMATGTGSYVVAGHPVEAKDDWYIVK